MAPGVREDEPVSEDHDEPVRFRATVELNGRTATGFEVPVEVVSRLGQGRRPTVLVRVGNHTYASTVAVTGGRWMLPLSAANRTAAGVSAGDEVEVELAADTAPRVVELPEDLSAALSADPAARATYDALPPSHRKEWVRWVSEAKRSETRSDRLSRTVAALSAGHRTR